MNQLIDFIDFYNKNSTRKNYFKMSRVLDGKNNVVYGIISPSLICVSGIKIGDDEICALQKCHGTDKKLTCMFDNNTSMILTKEKNDTDTIIMMTISHNGKTFTEKVNKYNSINMPRCSVDFTKIDDFLSN